MMVWRVLLALATAWPLSLALEREMTVHVEPGKEECFFESVSAHNSLTVEYQVIDGGSGQTSEFDINFRIVNPKGQPIFAEFKKPDGSHTHKSEVREIFMEKKKNCPAILFRKVEIIKFVSTTNSPTSALRQCILKYST